VSGNNVWFFAQALLRQAAAGEFAKAGLLKNALDGTGTDLHLVSRQARHNLFHRAVLFSQLHHLIAHIRRDPAPFGAGRRRRK
jgi:hypothetical protein